MWHVTPEREREREKKRTTQNKKTAFENMKANRRSNRASGKGKRKKLLESSQIIWSPRKTFKDISSETKRR